MMIVCGACVWFVVDNKGCASMMMMMELMVIKEGYFEKQIARTSFEVQFSHASTNWRLFSWGVCCCLFL